MPTEHEESGAVGALRRVSRGIRRISMALWPTQSEKAALADRAEAGAQASNAVLAEELFGDLPDRSQAPALRRVDTDARTERLNQSCDRLKAVATAGLQRTQMLAEAHALLAQEGAFLDQTTSDVSVPRRPDMVDAYFRLRRLVADQEQSAVAALPLREARPAAPSAEGIRSDERVYRARRAISRPAKMAIALGLMVAVRLALLPFEVGIEHQGPGQIVERPRGVNAGATHPNQAPREGQPSIQMAELSEDNGLTFIGLASPSDSRRKLDVTVSWRQDGKLLGQKMMRGDELIQLHRAPDELKVGATYYVEFDVSDGAGFSSASTPQIKYRGSGK